MGQEQSKNGRGKILYY